MLVYAWAPKPVCRLLNRKPDFQREMFVKVLHAFPSAAVWVLDQSVYLVRPKHSYQSNLYGEGTPIFHAFAVCVWLQPSQHLGSCPWAWRERSCDSTCAWDNAEHQENIYPCKYAKQIICVILNSVFSSFISWNALFQWQVVRKCAWLLWWETILTNADVAGQTT